MARGYLAGFARVLIGFLDSTGNFIGQSATLANGATSNAYVADKPKTANLAPASVASLDIQAGDKIQTTIQFGNKKQGTFQLILADFDTTLNDIISGATSNTTNSYSTITIPNSNRTTPRKLCVGLQSLMELTDGSGTYWMTRFFPNSSLRIAAGAMGYQAESDTVIDVTPSYVAKFINGKTIGSSGLNLGAEGDLEVEIQYISQNPIQLTAFRQDASATTFITAYRPLSTVITLNATPNRFSVGGTDTALSSIVTTTGVATLAAAGSAAVADLLISESNYVPV